MGFRESQKVEAMGNKILFPWLQRHPDIIGICVFGEGVLHLEMQALGDMVVQLKNEKSFRIIEIKVESSNDYGNFFLETWSNKAFPRNNPGWLLKSNADWLLYYFLKQDELYLMRMSELQEWIFGHDINCKPTICRYKEKQQNKYNQKNLTFGACVPIIDVKQNLNTFKVRHPKKELESYGFEFCDLELDYQINEATVDSDEKLDMILRRLELLEIKIDDINQQKKLSKKSLVRSSESGNTDLFGGSLH